MKSQTTVLAPIIAALVKAEDRLGADRVWKAINDMQVKFLESYFCHRDNLGNYKPEELRSWISNSAAELNQILAKEGFDIQLEEFPSGQFGVVSILDVLVEWIAKGDQINFQYGGQSHAGVFMTDFVDTEDGRKLVFESFLSSEHPHPIACVHTKSGDKVFMTIAGKEVEGLDLADAIDAVRKGQLLPQNYKQLEFPMVDYREKIDISWLIGMFTIDQNRSSIWDIAQAMQETKFRMNHEGARVKSAVAMAVRKFVASIPRVLKIDQPFWLWIERDGLAIPVMYGYFSVEDWKNPGSLEM